MRKFHLQLKEVLHIKTVLLIMMVPTALIKLYVLKGRDYLNITIKSKIFSLDFLHNTSLTSKLMYIKMGSYFD